MNRKLITWLTTGAVIIILCLSTAFLYLMWQEEKQNTLKAQEQAEEYKTKLEAAEQNKEVNISEIANDFVRVVFAYDKDQVQARRDKIKTLATDPAKGKLLGEYEDHTHEEWGDIEDSNITVNIKTTGYKKLSAEKAEADVVFEQDIEAGGNKAKQLQSVKLTIEYIDGKWLIKNYTVNSLF